MCYEKPGPRCSGHTRINFRAAQANLAAATNDLREKSEALKGAQSVEAQTALQASEKAHAQAVADLKEAEGKYQVSKENRAVAMEAYREAKAEYDASPEGIKKNRIRSANPKLTAEKREEARQAALEGAVARKESTEAWKAEQQKQAHQSEIKELAQRIDNDKDQSRESISGDISVLLASEDNSDLKYRSLGVLLRKTHTSGSDISRIIETTVGPDGSGLREQALEKWGKGLSPKAQEIIAQDSNPDVRVKVAQKQSLSPNLVRLLSSDRNKEVRAEVADRRELDNETQIRLLHDRADDVVCATLSKQQVPEEEIAKMVANRGGIGGSKISVKQMRYLVNHPNTPMETLKDIEETAESIGEYSLAGTAEANMKLKQKESHDEYIERMNSRSPNSRWKLSDGSVSSFG